MWTLLVLAAYGGDVDTWVGGAVSTGVDITADGPRAGITEAEVDVTADTDNVTGRLDLDIHLDPNQSCKDPGVPCIATPYAPEWAMVQFGKTKGYVRVGVTNPAVGLEDWDPWVNYLPTTSILFGAASPGRNLGVEVGMLHPSGADTFVWIGRDLDWGEYMTGAGVAYEGDNFGTWSGVAIYPFASMYGAFLSGEWYASDALTLSVDGGFGTIAGDPYGGVQLFAVIAPADAFAFTGRLEGTVDPNGAFNDPTDPSAPHYPKSTASLGVRVTPATWVRFDIEGKALFDQGSVSPRLHAQLTFMRQ